MPGTDTPEVATSRTKASTDWYENLWALVRTLPVREGEDIVIEVQGKPTAPVLTKIQVVKGEPVQARGLCPTVRDGIRQLLRQERCCSGERCRELIERCYNQGYGGTLCPLRIFTFSPAEGVPETISDELFMRKLWQALERLEYKSDRSEVAKVEIYRPGPEAALQLRHIAIISQPIIPLMKVPFSEASAVVKLPCRDCEVPDYDCIDGASCAKGLEGIAGKIALDYYPRGYDADGSLRRR